MSMKTFFAPGVTSRTRSAGLSLFLWVSLCLTIGVGNSAGAEEPSPWSLGDTIEAFELEDQFGNTDRVDKTTGLILFSRDMDGGEVLSAALEGKSAEFLADRQAVYVADISGMPGLVARLFALPKMRKRGYPMMLDRDGEATARLPDQEGSGTLIELDKLQIVGINFLSNAAELSTRLEALKPPPAHH